MICVPCILHPASRLRIPPSAFPILDSTIVQTSIASSDSVVRQMNAKRGPDPREALDRNPATVGLQDVFYNGQAKARSPEGSAASLIHPVESLKKAWQVIVGNTDAVVLDTDDQFGIPGIDVNLDPSCVVTVFNRVVEQVDDGLFHQRRIDSDPAVAVANDGHVDLTLFDPRLTDGHGTTVRWVPARRPASLQIRSMATVSGGYKCRWMAGSGRDALE